MTQEEKTKAYDEALERAKVAYKDEDRHFKATLERIFPELQERENSENKRISKEITQFLKQNNGWNREWLTWLEKQGKQEPYGQRKKCSNCQINYAGECKGYCALKRSEHKPTDEVEPKFHEGDIVQYITDSTDRRKIEEIDTLCNMYHTDSSPIMFEVENEWKVVVNAEDVEQESTNNVEPKFHEGVWVVNKLGDSWHIDSFDKKNYQVSDGKGNYNWFPISKQDEMHLWTIQDAKDGDVVVDKSDGTIGIFQSIGHHPDGGSYNDHSYCFLYCRYDDGFFYADFEHGNTIDSDDLIPATKKQRDLLFQKMADAGYEWDSKKKELKKVEVEMLDADKVIEWLRQNTCAACFDEPDEGVSQRIDKFKTDFELW